MIWISISIIFLIYFIDQLTKWLVQANMVFQSSNTVINGFLTIEYQFNPGMAWSLLDNATWVLVLISAVASIALGYAVLKNDFKHAKLYSIGTSVAFAGCIGNLFDRAISIIPYFTDSNLVYKNSSWRILDGATTNFMPQGRNGVVDMISFEPLNALSRLITKSNFPVFNVADAALVIGLILFAIDIIFFYDKRKKQMKEAKVNGNN